MIEARRKIIAVRQHHSLVLLSGNVDFEAFQQKVAAHSGTTQRRPLSRARGVCDLAACLPALPMK